LKKREDGSGRSSIRNCPCAQQASQREIALGRKVSGRPKGVIPASTENRGILAKNTALDSLPAIPRKRNANQLLMENAGRV
jgi:hypothetical protein